MPVLDDWESVEELIRRLDQVFASRPVTISVLLVDDGSVSQPSEDMSKMAYTCLQGISILRLKKNLGHQRALAVGLCHIVEKIECDAVLVMDGDGEDKPEDAALLLQRLEQLSGHSVVFAERGRRSEALIFRSGYILYKFLHLVLTGRSIRVGNFSAISRSCLSALTVEPMLWNHYAASVFRARLPMATVPTHRGVRIKGRSRLNFVALVVHGLSALACYGEIIGVRLILGGGVLLLLAFLALGALLGVKLFTSVAIPGWTSLSLCLIIIFIFQIVTLVSNFTMQIISERGSQPFLPARDYAWFVAGVKNLYSRVP